MDASRIVLEVTETAVLTTSAALGQLNRLKQLGFEVALDDFGTGYSSLSLLLDLPVDVLKVDESFVSGATAEGAGAIITKNLIGFMDDFGMEAVAEGVETDGQAERLRGRRLPAGPGLPLRPPHARRRFRPHLRPRTANGDTGRRGRVSVR